MESFGCNLLFDNNVVSDQLSDEAKPIAIEVENTFIGLKNLSVSTYPNALSACQRLSLPNREAKLPFRPQFEIWLKNFEQINSLIEKLKQKGIDADFLLKGRSYWLGEENDFIAQIINTSFKGCIMQNKSCTHLSRIMYVLN